MTATDPHPTALRGEPVGTDPSGPSDRNVQRRDPGVALVHDLAARRAEHDDPGAGDAVAGWVETELVVPVDLRRCAGLRRIVTTLAVESGADRDTVDDLELLVSEVFASIDAADPTVPCTISLRCDDDAVTLDMSVPAPARFAPGTYAGAVIAAIGRPSIAAEHRILAAVPR